MPDPLPPPPHLQVAAIGLFLDVDGTLVAIEREPGAVHVPERLCTVLEQLAAATDGALALVSGRSVGQIDQLFAPLRLNAAGLHGLERRKNPDLEALRVVLEQVALDLRQPSDPRRSAAEERRLRRGLYRRGIHRRDVPRR